MTTFHTYDIDSVPAPSDIELADRPAFKPFVAVRRGRIVTIRAQLPSGIYVDATGHYHAPSNLDLDLNAYAEQQAAAYRDLIDTQADALV